MKMETVALCQQKANERRAAEYVAKNNKKRNKAKCKKVVMGTLIAAFFIASCGIVGKNDLEAEGIVLAKESETEQKYIVRYGITEDGGETILTEDGNGWKLIDPPEYEDGTEVRVLFDSKETMEVEDDEIIDMTERQY